MKEIRIMCDIVRSTGLRLIIALFLLFTGLPSFSEPWTITPQISLGETFSDNLRLTSSKFKESDFITSLTPGIFIKRQGKRLDFSVNYRLQGLFYENNPKNNKVINLLDASGTGEWIKDRFFVDVSSTSSEQNITNNGIPTTDNTSLTDDRGKVVTYSVSPYWRERIGNYMDTEIRYARNAVESSRTLDSYQDKISYNATSGTVFSRFLWDLNLKYDKINYDVENSARFINIIAESEFLLTDKIAFKTVAGYDENEFTSSTENKIDGYLWRLGGIYKPSRRTSFEGTFGERFFGTDIFIEVSHRIRYLQWLLTFYRQPDTARSILLEQQVFPLTDIFGNPVFNQTTGEQRRLNVNVPVQSSEVFIRERINSALNFAYKNKTLSFSAFRENRDYQISRRVEEVYGIDLAWTWAVNKKTDLSLTLAYNANNTFNNRKQEFKIIGYRLTRLLTPDLSASFTYNFVNLSSNIRGESYTQNRFSASISKQF